MNVLLIGRTKILLETAKLLISKNFYIVGIITSKSAIEYEINENDLKTFALIHKIKYLYEPKITLSKLLKFVEGISIDIGVSVNYTSIIPKDVIDQFKLGILNAHGGDLPRYRGNACQAWAILKGEKKIGICIHKMIGDELDSGDIIARDYYPISINTRISEVYDFFNSVIPKLFIDSINNLIIDSNFFLEKQTDIKKNILRCYPRNRDDLKIDWNLSNKQILRLINASCEPYQGAFSFVEEKRVIVWRASLVNTDYQWLGSPGQFAEFKGDSLVILTGNGKIKLDEIEIGNVRNSPKHFFKSLRLRFR